MLYLTNKLIKLVNIRAMILAQYNPLAFGQANRPHKPFREGSL